LVGNLGVDDTDCRNCISETEILEADVGIIILTLRSWYDTYYHRYTVLRDESTNAWHD
jgi:hypothetical protein